MAKVPKKLLHSVRFTALEALERINHGGAYSNLLLNELIKKNQVDKRDAALLTEIVYGTLSRQISLAYFVAPFIKRAKKVEPWVNQLLQLSAYQMIYLDRVPDHAILNEAVEIAKAKGNAGIGKFVNGVLRSMQRRGFPEIEAIKDPIERLATEISMPRFLVEKFIKEIGKEETRELGLSLLEPSHVSARVDLREISREAALNKLAEEGIDAWESLVSPYGIVAEKGFLAGSELYQAGLITVQDESSMLVAPVMELEKEQKVLDACSAPGGKTTHIAALLDGTGEITALDIHAHKLKLVRENAERLHVSEQIKTIEMDAREVENRFQRESFDRILIDAPCSGLGLMRRKPDLKYQKKSADFVQLPKIQRAILDSCAPTLKVDGILVYSTCTIAPEENQQVVAGFLQDHPEFEKIDLAVNETLAEQIKDQMLTLYPQDFMTDGFFICGMKKKSRGEVPVMEIQFQSDIGKRRHTNQDYANVFTNQADLKLAILADGMGGHQAGDVASKMIVDGLGEAWSQSNISDDQTINEWFVTEIQKENETIYHEGNTNESLKGMGTTIVSAALFEDGFTLAHVGDSRAYQISEDTIVQLTDDHSLVNELVKSGEITEEMAAVHPQKNILTRSIGVFGSVEVDVSEFTYQTGDYLLLCSDGLTNMVSEEDILVTITSDLTIEEKTKSLISAANEAGGSDNITVLLIHFEKEDQS
ncbi:ribosomal RNA small subunit methyltransferase B [Enterococcus sp. AZ103]|uniref:16S rRNA (cytosine(967)-C(5))-methyltransferase n=2 Tax=Enterococcus TaxID=1350 RepID=A0ABS6TFV8_9ENTE|nr:16S rRNA (cytosine(967)-C(5))-methyltransferase RsmB [Enterococcus alishanensis]